MPTWLLIALPVVTGVALLLLVLRWTMGLVERRLKRMIHERFGREDMLQASGANLMGQRARTAGGLKGRGVLVLTRDKLWFGLAVPERELDIPVAAIRSVSLPKSFMGRSIFRELLCVRFASAQGEDEVAWAVREPDKWRQALELIRASR
jgi:hypothetical protein